MLYSYAFLKIFMRAGLVERLTIMLHIALQMREHPV